MTAGMDNTSIPAVRACIQHWSNDRKKTFTCATDDL